MKLERRLGLKDDESLLAAARAAPVTLALSALLIAVLLAAPLFFLVPLLRLQTLGYVIIGVSLFLGAFFGLRGWIKWRGSLLAVTERRLIIVRQNGFFERQVTEIPYAKVHEISYRVRGLFATMFRYGTLLIESAGSEAPLEMRRVPRPAALQDLIAEQQARSGRGRSDFGEMLQAVSGMETRQLRLLKAEVDRTLRLRPLDDGV